jgi:hypothetical protein
MNVPTKTSAPKVRRGCVRCGGEKEPGRGKQYCSECRELLAAKCARCGKNHRRLDGPYPDLCGVCVRWVRTRQRRYRKAHTKRQRLERQRREALAREEAMFRLPQAVEPTRPGGNGQGWRKDAASFPDLPAAPLVDHIERYIRKRSQHHEYNFMPKFTDKNGEQMLDSTRNHVCAELGISDKALRSWKAAEWPRVMFDTADLVLQRADWTWRDVWTGDELAVNGKTVREVFESEELTVQPLLVAA